MYVKGKSILNLAIKVLCREIAMYVKGKSILNLAIKVLCREIAKKE
jgi:hypothetical protein